MNWNGEKLNVLCEERGVFKSELLGVDPPQLYDGKQEMTSASFDVGGKLFKKTGIKLVYALLTDLRLLGDAI